MTNITKFVNSFNTELARPYNYEVYIEPTSSLLEILNKNMSFTGEFNENLNNFLKYNGATNTSSNSLLGTMLQRKIVQDGKNKFAFRCESSTIPGRTFGLVEQKTYGPVQRHPISNFFADVKLSFICDDTMYEKIFFDSWLECISVSSINSISEGYINENYVYQKGMDLGFGVRFDFSYKDDYSCVIKIVQKDVTGKSSYEVSLMEAFPYAVDSMPLSWKHIDSYHRVNVSFTYKYFETNKSLKQFFNS